MTAVEIIVFTISTRRSEPKRGVRTGLSNLEKKIPYITRAMLFPTSMVAIYCPGFLVKNLRITELNSPCLISSSRRNLFEEIKAISMPEKNAENNIARSMIRIPFIQQS
jgi:hypothetical protein